MSKAALIAVKTFCVHHQIECSFILALQSYGLVEIIPGEGEDFIPVQQVNKLEKFIRLNRDLEINPEGIDAIFHLLNRVGSMQEKIISLQNRLSLYEMVE